MFDFLSQKLSGVLQWMSGKSRLTPENINAALDQLKTALLEADVPLHVVKDFLGNVSNEVLGQKVHERVNPGDNFIKIVHDKLLSFLSGESTLETFSPQIPSVIMVMGLQGSGKTTTVAKLAYWIKKEAAKRNKTRRILLASVDYYRPAAIKQLSFLANQISVDFYQSASHDPIQAAYDIHSYFKNNNYELLFLDTAGRLHIDTTMMEELKTTKTIVQPKHSFLVLDAMTGQESLNVAQEFNTTIGFQSAILTKLDSDTRGGAAFAFRYLLKKPISFVGSGEKVDDLELFIPKRAASRILGMGDIVSLVEKANETIDTKKQESMARRMMRGDISLDDFAQQLEMIGKVGSLQKIIKYLPGMGSLSPEMLEQSEQEMKIFKAVMSSMTPKERLFPQLLDSSRKQRIAKGSGSEVSIINQLLQKFEQSKQFVKMFKKMGKMPRFFG